MAEEQKVNFQQAVVECAMNKHFVEQFNRLCDCKFDFTDRRVPIEKMIDEATGNPNIFKNNKDEVQKFISFVFETVWIPLMMSEDHSEVKKN